jgi:anti-sigma regulatory factor (Ser/Thr protein kinase)
MNILLSEKPEPISQELIKRLREMSDIFSFHLWTRDQTHINWQDFQTHILSDKDYIHLKKNNVLSFLDLVVFFPALKGENIFSSQPQLDISTFIFGSVEERIEACLEQIMTRVNHEKKNKEDGFAITREDWDLNSLEFDKIVAKFQLTKMTSGFSSNFKMILQELLSNVFNHTNSPQAILDIKESDESIEISVSDSAGVFQKNRFYSSLFRSELLASPNLQTKGAGIGLFMVAQFCRELSVILDSNKKTLVKCIIPKNKVRNKELSTKKIISFREIH